MYVCNTTKIMYTCIRSCSALHVRDPGPLKCYTEVRIKIDYYVHVYVCNTAQFMYTSNFHSYIMSSSDWNRIPCGCGGGSMCCLNPALCCDSTCVDSLE